MQMEYLLKKSEAGEATGRLSDETDRPASFVPRLDNRFELLLVMAEIGKTDGLLRGT